MPTPAKLNSMRQKRDNHLDIIKDIESDTERYKQANEHDRCLLEEYQAQLEDELKQFRLIEEGLQDLGERDSALERETVRTCVSLRACLKNLMLTEQPSTSSAPKGSDFPEAKMHLPEMRLPAFDGKFEQWSAFYNTFISTKASSHSLTATQEFH